MVVGGDYTQNGFPDYLIGSPNQSVGINAAVGTVGVLSGASGAPAA